jgi:hypothetical protein
MKMNLKYEAPVLSPAATMQHQPIVSVKQLPETAYPV